MSTPRDAAESATAGVPVVRALTVEQKEACGYLAHHVLGGDGFTSDHARTLLALLADFERRHKADTSELDTARAEIERLGKSETVAKSDAAYYAKVLFKFRDTLLNVQDGIEEEGDRTYFGSTNDADQLRDISQKIDGLKWDKIMEASQPPVDLYALIADLREQLAASQSALTAAQARIAEQQASLEAIELACLSEDDDSAAINANVFDIVTRARATLSPAVKEPK